VEERDIYDGESSWLAEMMAVDSAGEVLWKEEEFGAILECQLSAAIEFDLGYFGDQTSQRVKALCSQQQPPIRSFHDLFHHPCPPVELLQLTKEFARSCRSRPDPLLPDEVAPLLYVLAIAVAITKCGRRISRLDDQALRHSLGWALNQSWVDEPTRGLLQMGHQAIADEELDSNE
jgi:hypothetical protein